MIYIVLNVAICYLVNVVDDLCNYVNMPPKKKNMNGVCEKMERDEDKE